MGQQGATEIAPAALSPNETHPNAKRLANEIAVALTTYDQGETLEAFAGRLAFAGAASQELAATFFVPGATSRGRIVYPQLGGLTDNRTSVMVVVEHTVILSEGTQSFTRTFDIRLVMRGGAWAFESLESAGGTVIDPPATLSAQALAVLNDPRIELPDSARWDIYKGEISDKLLAMMSRLAEITSYGVITLAEGHPTNVFGTDRLSDHMRGLAVDIYRIGDRLVIDDRAAGSATQEATRWLLDQSEVRQVGSPWRFETMPGRSFTDAVHQDHLHLAVHP